MANRSVNFLELARFLIDKRDSTSREKVGLTRRAQRRTPGLLPQEVCNLAGVSLTSYERLERGRPLHLTRTLLARIAQAFRLEADEINTLYLLADFSGSISSKLSWELQAVLDQFKTVPAWVCTPRLDVIAFNRPADVLFDFRGDGSLDARNQLWRLYTDPARRKVFKDCVKERASLLARFKFNFACTPDASPYVALLDRLRSASLSFDRDYDARIAPQARADKTVTVLSTAMGIVSTSAIELAVGSNSPDTLFVYLPADEGSAMAIRALYAKPYWRARTPKPSPT